MQLRIFNKLIPLGGRQTLVAVTVLFLTGICVGYWLPSVSLPLCAAEVALCVAWLFLRISPLQGLDFFASIRRALSYANRWQGFTLLSKKISAPLRLCVSARKSPQYLSLLDVAILSLGVFFLGVGRVAWNVDAVAREIEAVGNLSGRQAFVCKVTSSPVAKPSAGLGMRYTVDAGDVSWRDGGKKSGVRYLPVVIDWYGSVFDRQQAPQPGETWQMFGRMKIKEGRKGQYAYLSTGKGEKRTLRLTSQDKVWTGRLQRAQREAARYAALGIEDWGDVPALNQAMLLGCRNEMPDEMKRVFAASGTIHVFAISGLHIALVAGMLLFFLRLTGLPRLRWVFALAPLLIAYTMLTGMRPSAVRACCMAVCMSLAPLLGRRPDGLSALLATSLALHFWQPSLVFDAGSVLSFSTMAGLILLVPPIVAFMRRCLGCLSIEKRIELLEAAGTRAKWTRRGAWVVKYVADVFAVSVAAWLASVPLTGYYFGRVPIGGLGANPVVTTCAFFIVTAGCLGMLSALVSPWLAATYNNAAGFFTMVMVRTAEATASVKVLSLETGNWPGWAVALWIVTLVALAVWIRKRWQTKDGLEWLTGDAKPF